jgi:monovalent cation:H+ antiporter, CPA1 family
LNSVVLSVLGVSALLAGISIVVPIARRLMLPYTLVLAVLGCLIGLLGYFKVGVAGFGGEVAQGLNQIGLLDDAFIYIFLPPLLFSAGLTVDVRHILEDIGYVILLAFVAVILCTVFVGYGLELATGLGLLPCLLLGTIVSTTDTAAVINIFREAGAPKRLSAIVEGEALFNDAAAIAMFGLFLSMVTLGTKLDFLSAAWQFVVALVGGAVFGYAMARTCGWVISLLQDSVTTEVTLTVSLAYFTFVVSNEILGISGVIATVTLAAFIGSDSRTRVSPGSWEILHNVWEHLDFWATSFIFVISAMYIPRSLNSFGWGDLANVAVVFVAALASRAVVIGGMMPTFSAIGVSKPLGRAYKIVLWWGGMRGAVTVALALATTANDGVPPAVRHLVVSTAIGYVIASLIVNGLTLRPLMSAFRLDRFNAFDLVLRDRMTALARRKIKRELSEVAAAVGCDAEALSREIVPMDKASRQKSKAAVNLAVAMDTWCHHELDTVLALRERGLITRHHAEQLRNHADRLLNALKNGELKGYLSELKHLRRAGAMMRLTFWLFAHFGWSTTLKVSVAARMEFLIAELLLVRELIAQCDGNAAGLFGRDVAAELDKLLRQRLETTESEIRTIEQAYPKFADAMHQRYLTLVALGLVEAEYRRHLAEATISVDVFENLDAQRRAVAARFTRRPELEAGFDTDAIENSLPLAVEFPALKSCIRPFLALPGQRITFERNGRKRAFLVVFGHVEARQDGAALSLGPGAFIGLDGNLREATASGYVNLLEIDRAKLAVALDGNPSLASAFREAAAAPVDPVPATG